MELLQPFRANALPMKHSEIEFRDRDRIGLLDPLGQPIGARERDVPFFSENEGQISKTTCLPEIDRSRSALVSPAVHRNVGI